MITDIHSLLHAADCAFKKFEASPWWRGHGSCTAWKLVPHIHRKPIDRLVEQSIVTEFRTKARTRHTTCPPQGDMAGWLFLMQHYGLPTRLLDWSESPLVAAYFAVTEKDTKNETGALFALAPATLNACQARKSGVLTADTPEVIEIVMNAFDFRRPSTSRILAVGANQVDSRMLAQQSQFTIHDTDQPITDLEDCDKFLIQFEIPATAKETIREQLHRLGIDASTVFPDLQHLAYELAERREIP